MAKGYRIRPERGMIHYQLRCDQNHEFDGWFNGSAGFEKQAALGLIECPTCGGTKVERALMTPAVSKRDSARDVPVTKSGAQTGAGEPEIMPPAPPPEPPRNGVMPAQLVALLQRMRAEVEKNCDYVGPSFAEEARKIHRGEAEERGIYGETTPEEAETLADEGIEVRSIPWVPPADG